jgi:hypothetical protein
MKTETYFRFVNEVIELVRANRPMWYRMSKAKVASWRYLNQLSQGNYEKPDIEKLTAIKDYIRAEKKLAA